MQADTLHLEHADAQPVDHSFQLKFLNGPLSGHRLYLPIGDLTMGSGDADVRVEIEGDHAAMLSITEESVSLTTSAPCWIDGRPTIGCPLQLPILTPVDVGGVGFVVAAAGETITIATVPRRIALGPKTRRTRALSLLVLTSLAALASAAAGTGVWHYGQIKAARAPVPIEPP
ncbi:MAG: hypothetical protein ABW110_10020, partial [Steroidobacteraceae bacterium]